MAVRADQAGDDGAASGVDHPRSFGNCDLRAHGGDPVSLDHDGCAFHRRSSGPVDEPGTLKDDRLCNEECGHGAS